MAIDHSPILYSYEDYAALDDGRRYEVVEGELIEMTSPSRRHQRLLVDLVTFLNVYARASRAGEVFAAPFDVILRGERPADVFQPDILYIARARKDIVTAANVQGAPDLAVEILSPSTARLDRVRKSRRYAAHGVAELWFIPHDVDRIEVYAFDGEGAYGKPTLFMPGETLTSDHLPGFALDVAALFADLE